MREPVAGHAGPGPGAWGRAESAGVRTHAAPSYASHDLLTQA